MYYTSLCVYYNSCNVVCKSEWLAPYRVTQWTMRQTWSDTSSLQNWTGHKYDISSDFTILEHFTSWKICPITFFLILKASWLEELIFEFRYLFLKFGKKYNHATNKLEYLTLHIFIIIIRIILIVIKCSKNLWIYTS